MFPDINHKVIELVFFGVNRFFGYFIFQSNIDIIILIFNFSTVITIAHRLNTILDYDRVMVLSEGRVVELDPPKELMHKEGTVFRGMCQVIKYKFYTQIWFGEFN